MQWLGAIRNQTVTWEMLTEIYVANGITGPQWVKYANFLLKGFRVFIPNGIRHIGGAPCIPEVDGIQQIALRLVPIQVEL